MRLSLALSLTATTPPASSLRPHLAPSCPLPGHPPHAPIHARVCPTPRAYAHTPAPRGGGPPPPYPPGVPPTPYPPPKAGHNHTCPTYPKHGAKQDHNALACTLCHPFRRGRRLVPHTETIRHPPPPPRHTHEPAHTPPNRTRSLLPVTTPTRPTANTSR